MLHHTNDSDSSPQRVRESPPKVTTEHPKHPGLLPQNIRMYCPKRWGSFRVKDPDVFENYMGMFWVLSRNVWLAQS